MYNLNDNSLQLLNKLNDLILKLANNVNDNNYAEIVIFMQKNKFDSNNKLIDEVIKEAYKSKKQKLIEKIANNNDIDFITSGYTIQLFRIFKDEDNNISFTVLSPYSDFPLSDSNACSQVVLLEMKEGCVLFMGDSDVHAEKKVLSVIDCSIDVLQSAHHGSAQNTNTSDFINRIKPRISVISCGFNNSYGHPHKETLEILTESGTKILRTDTDGCITIIP